jgi:uncharacterized protein YcbK (DUF882 family)
MQPTHGLNALSGEPLRCGARFALLFAIALALVVLAPGSASAARAEREHTVGKGQTLVGIAARYGVPVASLAAANGLGRDAPLREGKVLIVPARGVVYVAPGDTLSLIARRHDVGTAELARANRMQESAPLRPGQRLLLPGFEAARSQLAAERAWGAPRTRGVATLHRLATDLTRRVRLVDDRGRVRRPALRELSALLRPRNSRRSKEPHPRLVRLLARVSDHFGGRPIHIVSGYRKPGGNTRATSRHVAAQAIDFRIPGVPLAVLRDYCARLDHVGVGYYPRSNFVHLDVRRSSARWTDLAGPGETARIERAGASSGERSARAPAVAVDTVTRASQPVLEPADDEPRAEDEGEPPVTDELDELSPEGEADVPP